MKHLLIISSLAILLISCANTKNIFIKKEKKEKNICKKAELGIYPSQSDKFDILDVKISGNIMTLKIGYAGGCKNHEFSIIGSQMISKSLPPIRNIQLIHNSNDDSCESYVTQNLDIDISNLAYKKVNGSDIILKLNGWKERIVYTYN
tara:strand:+ start:205 stop:648 length:444 start_codon:yes stop_codon:yes gene_type:complete